MTGKRIIILILLIVALGALAYGVRSGMSKAADAQTTMDEQVAVIEQCEAEHAELAAEIERVTEEIAALPDSVRDFRAGGMAMKTARRVAKRQEFLDGQERRATVRFDAAVVARASAIRQTVIWVAASGLPALALLIALFTTGRRRSSHVD